jgi:hypothetical protein
MVELVVTIQRWIGLSTDTKPEAPERVGSTFHELDTGKKFIWDGDSWVQDVSMIYAIYQAGLGMPDTGESS